MKLSEILTPKEVERRIRRTFQLRKLIKALKKENAEILTEMKKSRSNQTVVEPDRVNTNLRSK